MSARLVVRMMVVLAVVLSFAGTVFGATTFGVTGEATLVDQLQHGQPTTDDSLAVDGATVYISYDETPLDGHIYPVVVRSNSSGNFWDSKSIITSHPCNSYPYSPNFFCSPRIEIGPRPINGSETLLHAVWQGEEVYGGPYLYYSRAFIPEENFEALQFSTPIIITDPGVTSVKTAIDGFGNLHIMYHSYYYGGDIYSIRITEDTSGNPIVEGPVALGVMPTTFDVAADSAGNSYAVFGNGVLYKKNYSADYLSTNWIAIGAPYNGSYPAYVPTLIVKDPNIIFVADFPPNVYVSATEDGGATWQQYDVTNLGVLGLTMALEPSGSVVLALDLGSNVHFSRGTKSHNKWSFTNPISINQSLDYSAYSDIISLPATNEVLISFRWRDCLYSTKEQ